MSSQLPDTPNSMVSSPIEAWTDVAWTDWTEHRAVHRNSQRHQTTSMVVFWHCEDNHGIFTTDPNSNVHPRVTGGCVTMTGAARSSLVTVAKTTRHELDSINILDLWVGENSEFYTCDMLCARSTYRNNEWWFIWFETCTSSHNRPFGEKQHCFSSFNYTIPFITQVLKHLQQGIPLFCHKLRGTVVS